MDMRLEVVVDSRSPTSTVPRTSIRGSAGGWTPTSAPARAFASSS